MISRTVAESVFALMDARGIVANDVVVIGLYNSGPTLHLEPAAMLRAFWNDGIVYDDYTTDMHGRSDVGGIRIVAVFCGADEMDKLRSIGKSKLECINQQPAPSEVEA
jgi:hypothetical protein